MTTMYEIPAYLRRPYRTADESDSLVTRDKAYYTGYLDGSLNAVAAQLRSTASCWVSPVGQLGYLVIRPDMALEYLDNATREVELALARLKEARELVAEKLLKDGN